MRPAAQKFPGCSGKSGHCPAATYAGCHVEASRRWVRRVLDRIAKLLGGADACSLDLSQVRYEQAAALRQYLEDTQAPRTARNRLALFRGWLREAKQMRRVTPEHYDRLTSIKPRAGTQRVRPGRFIPRPEIDQLFEKSLNGPEARAARDCALLAVLYGAGLRRGEAVKLRVRDYDPENGSIRLHDTKTDEDRMAYVPSGLRHHVERWITYHRSIEDPLFCAVAKGGRIVSGQISTDAIGKFCRAAATRAGLAHITAHDFRRSFITELLDRGADAFTVARLAGHKNVQTTMDYDRRTERAKQDAVELLGPAERSED